jgi:LacI family transcriptional regulator
MEQQAIEAIKTRTAAKTLRLRRLFSGATTLECDIPRVAVLVDTSSGWGRRLNHGIVMYSQAHGPWDIWLEPRGQHESLRLPRGWKPDGVIARVVSQAMVKHLRTARVPVVNVSGIRIPGSAFPQVTTDTQTLAASAVTHLRDRGLQHFAFVGLPNRTYSLDRQHAFEKACLDAGFECHAYSPRNINAIAESRRYEAALTRWLTTLPHPVGVFTWGIERGVHVILAARAAGLRVPDDVAVLGGDDDEILCLAVKPTLSGILVPSQQIGYEAAALLDHLMHGGPAPNSPMLMQPAGISARASTDLLAIDDDDVISAVRFIRSHPDRPICVNDVAKAVAVSRRVLERKFRHALDKTVNEEISQVHLERAKSLLATTDLPIPKIALLSGYGSPEYLATVFKAAVGMSPSRFRSQVRGR